jgi:hypothetical protein
MAFYIYAVDGSGFAAFDLLESETHTETCKATEHNVEDGSPVTDHVVIESSMLSLSLGVTNTPTGPDPDKGRGATMPIEIDLPTWQAGFDGTPGAQFRALSQLNGGPVPQTATVHPLVFVPSFDRISETEQILLDIKNGAKLCGCVTSSRTYDNMVIERAELRRDKPGMGMFSIDMRQIRFVKTASVQAPQPLEPRGQPMKKAGQQAPQQTPEQDVAARRSVVIGLINKVFPGALD